jgi:hypothetical protein
MRSAPRRPTLVAGLDVLAIDNDGLDIDVDSGVDDAAGASMTAGDLLVVSSGCSACRRPSRHRCPVVVLVGAGNSGSGISASAHHQGRMRHVRGLAQIRCAALVDETAAAAVRPA